MAVTSAKLREFDERGVIMLEGLVSPRQLTAAAAAAAELTPQPENGGDHVRADGSVDTGARVGFGSRDGGIVAPALLDVAQHVWLERIAQQLLRTDDVSLFRSSVLSTYRDPPEDPPTEWSFHIDQQFGLRDWHAAPRRAQVALWLFLSDVLEGQAPMMVCPGSHRAVAQL